MSTTYMAVSPLLLGLRWLRIEFSLSAAISLKTQVHLCESESESERTLSFKCLLIQLKPRCRGNWHTMLTYKGLLPRDNSRHKQRTSFYIFILYILYMQPYILVMYISYGYDTPIGGPPLSSE